MYILLRIRFTLQITKGFIFCDITKLYGTYIICDEFLLYLSFCLDNFTFSENNIIMYTNKKINKYYYNFRWVIFIFIFFYRNPVKRFYFLNRLPLYFIKIRLLFLQLL